MKATVPTLKIRVEEVVAMREGTAPSAVRRPVPSPYFQIETTFRVQREVDWSTAKPRGPTVFIDMDDLGADLA